MRIHMYMSTEELEKYRAGRVAWGVSKEGRRDYPYMNIHVDVDERDVVGLDTKTMPVYDSEGRKTGECYTFVRYDVVKGGDTDE